MKNLKNQLIFLLVVSALLIGCAPTDVSNDDLGKSPDAADDLIVKDAIAKDTDAKNIADTSPKVESPEVDNPSSDSLDDSSTISAPVTNTNLPSEVQVLLKDAAQITTLGYSFSEKVEDSLGYLVEQPRYEINVKGNLVKKTYPRDKIIYINEEEKLAYWVCKDQKDCEFPEEAFLADYNLEERKITPLDVINNIGSDSKIVSSKTIMGRKATIIEYSSNGKKETLAIDAYYGLPLQRLVYQSEKIVLEQLFDNYYVGDFKEGSLKVPAGYVLENLKEGTLSVEAVKLDSAFLKSFRVTVENTGSVPIKPFYTLRILNPTKNQVCYEPLLFNSTTVGIGKSEKTTFGISCVFSDLGEYDFSVELFGSTTPLDTYSQKLVKSEAVKN